MIYQNKISGHRILPRIFYLPELKSISLFCTKQVSDICKKCQFTYEYISDINNTRSEIDITTIQKRKRRGMKNGYGLCEMRKRDL